MLDETRLSGTYGSDIDPLDDVDYPFELFTDDDGFEVDTVDIDYDFENDEPYLWADEIEYDDVTVDFPF